MLPSPPLRVRDEAINIIQLNQTFPTELIRKRSQPADTVTNGGNLFQSTKGRRWWIIYCRMLWTATGGAGTRAVNVRLRERGASTLASAGQQVYYETVEVAPIASQTGLIQIGPAGGPAAGGGTDAPNAIGAPSLTTGFGQGLFIDDETELAAVDRAGIDNADTVRWIAAYYDLDAIANERPGRFV